MHWTRVVPVAAFLVAGATWADALINPGSAGSVPSPTFTDLTVTGNTALGDATTDTITATGKIVGTTCALRFDGATVDTVHTCISVPDATSSTKTITLPAGSVTLAKTTDETLSYTDNTAAVGIVKEGSNNYLALTTTNSSENVSIGNATTNPTISLLGTGAVTVGGAATITGATTLSSTLDVKDIISNTGASNNGDVYVNDRAKIYKHTAASAVPVLVLQNGTADGTTVLSFTDQADATGLKVGYGNTDSYITGVERDAFLTGAPAISLNVVSSGSKRVMDLSSGGVANSRTDLFNGDLMLNDLVRLPSATYASTDCDASDEVGRIVMHGPSSNKITACICVQTGAATYAFTPIPVATGVCP